MSSWFRRLFRIGSRRKQQPPVIQMTLEVTQVSRDGVKSVLWSEYYGNRRVVGNLDMKLPEFQEFLTALSHGSERSSWLTVDAKLDKFYAWIKQA